MNLVFRFRQTCKALSPDCGAPSGWPQVKSWYIIGHDFQIYIDINISLSSSHIIQENSLRIWTERISQTSWHDRSLLLKRQLLQFFLIFFLIWPQLSFVFVRLFRGDFSYATTKPTPTVFAKNLPIYRQTEKATAPPLTNPRGYRYVSYFSVFVSFFFFFLSSFLS